MSQRVRKAIIPAAGLGTRFLPATKTVPKELLPIVDRPILLYVVEEAVRAGIEDIVLIAGRGKGAIEDFFDVTYELEDKLERTGKTDVLASLKRIRSLANIISIRQHEALGLGHAILCGKPIVGAEAFAVLLGDEVMIAPAQTEITTATLAKSFEASGISAVAVMEVPASECSKYGIVEGDRLSNGAIDIRNVIEKPSLGQTTSRWALPGRYVFSSDIFPFLKDTKPGKNGEIQLTDAMVTLAKKHGLHGLRFHAKRYDAGDKLGFLQANIELALDNPEVKSGLVAYLKSLAQTL